MTLRNTYYALRHGESTLNRAGILQSDPEQGEHESLGITPNGQEQVKTSITVAAIAGELSRSTIIFSSPFTRCLQTAQIAKELLKTTNPIYFDNRLRERDFGMLNEQPSSEYRLVEEVDQQINSHDDLGIENATLVQHRTMSLVHELEHKYEGKTFLLVSHGDPLQILQTAFEQKPAQAHRSLPHLHPGELRKLN